MTEAVDTPVKAGDLTFEGKMDVVDFLQRDMGQRVTMALDAVLSLSGKLTNKLNNKVAPRYSFPIDMQSILAFSGDQISIRLWNTPTGRNRITFSFTMTAPQATAFHIGGLLKEADHENEFKCDVVCEIKIVENEMRITQPSITISQPIGLRDWRSVIEWESNIRLHKVVIKS